jgi:integrase
MSRKRRPSGVRRLGPDLFEIRVRVVDPHQGSVKSKKQRVRAFTEREAASKRPTLRRLLMSQIEGRATAETTDEAPSPRTLSDFAKLWIEDGASDGSTRFSTLETRRMILNGWILPYLGDRPVAELRRADIKDWLRRVRAERKPGRPTKGGTTSRGAPYAPVTVHGWYRTLRALVHYALDELEIEDHDPTARLRVPMGDSVRVTEEEPNSLDLASATRFLAAVQDEPPDIRAMVLIGLLGGPRRGEVLELRWGDINRREGEIRFSRSVYRGRVSKTKTSKARKIALHPILADALEAHRRAVGVDNVTRIPTRLVFPSAKAGKSRSGSFLTKHLRRICERAEIEIRFTQQGLRRTANNLRRLLGIDGTVIRSEIGHSSEKMTEHYSSVSATERQASMDRVVKAITEVQLAPKLAPSSTSDTTAPIPVAADAGQA